MALTQQQEDRRQERIGDILTSAFEIVSMYGLEALTMRSLAKHMGYSYARAFYYFEDRRALITTMQLFCIHDLTQYMKRRMVEYDGDAIGRVREAAGTWSSYRAVNPQQYRLIDQSFSSPNTLLSDEQRAKVDEALGNLLALVAEAIQAAPFRPGDPQLRTHVLWAAVHGAAHFEKRGDADAIETEIVDALIRGWS